MGRPEKPVDVSGGAVAAFARDLRRLRREAGNPTYREMAQSALYSSSVLSSAASGNRLPTLQVTLAFVASCGGDRALWERRWYQVSGNSGVHIGQVRKPEQRDPAPRRMPPRPAQLPLRPRGFVGRVAELRRLGMDNENPTAPVVVSGPPGVGKSDFALRYAHQVSTELTDGQLYADLQEVDPGEPGSSVLAGFLHALGVTGADLPASAHQQAGLYRSLLAEQRLVVLLENVRDEQQVRPLLGETRRSVTIMVSRTPLLGLRDVRRVALGVLPRADSIAMIAAAAPERAGADPQACAELAELCGDLPLALDIAARKLAARPDLDLRAVVDRLTEPRGLLSWLTLGDISVRESLSSAYARLSAPAVRLLGQLARRPTAEFSCRGTGHTTAWGNDDALVTELVEAGLLRPGGRPDSYRLDALVRAFTEDRSVPLARSSTWENLVHGRPVTRNLSAAGRPSAL
jgi:hypothetical protein